MKNKELCLLLGRICSALEECPEGDAKESIQLLAKALQNKKTAKSGKKSFAKKKNSSEDIISKDYHALKEELESKSIPEIKEALCDTDLFPTTQSLKDFALLLGITFQSRINRENVVHSIIKYIDRSRLDKTIASRGG